MLKLRDARKRTPLSASNRAFLRDASSDDLERRLRSVKRWNHWWVNILLIVGVGIAGVPVVAVVSMPVVVIVARLVEKLTGWDWSTELAATVALAYLGYLLWALFVDWAGGGALRQALQDRLSEMPESCDLGEPSQSPTEVQPHVPPSPHAPADPAEEADSARSDTSTDKIRWWGDPVERPAWQDTVPPIRWRLSDKDRDMPPYRGQGPDFLTLTRAAKWLSDSGRTLDESIAKRFLYQCMDDQSLRTYSFGYLYILNGTDIDRLFDGPEDDDDGTAGVPAVI